MALVSHVRADFLAENPGVPLVLTNDAFNWDAPPQKFVELEIEFQGASQIALEGSPRSRLKGHIYVNINVREGTGTKEANLLEAWFIDKLQYRTLGPAETQAVEPDGHDTTKGYYSRHLKSYFYADPS